MNGTGHNGRRRELSQLLRQCVQCGLCLPHCATWLVTRDEVQSPRGRLLVLRQWLENADEPPPDSFLAAMDGCIGCRACESTCPSGVPFSLLDHGLTLAQGHPRTRKTRTGPQLPPALLNRLDRSGFLRLLAGLGRFGRGLLRGVWGKNWRRRLQHSPAGLSTVARQMGAMPRAPRRDDQLVALLEGLLDKAGGGSTGRDSTSTRPLLSASVGMPPLAFFTGCANASLLPATSRRLLDLLRAAGCSVEIVPGQDCCGALASHTGRPGRAAALHRTNRDAFASCLDRGAEIVVEAAGCGLEFRGLGGAFDDRVIDATSSLARLDLENLTPIPLRVAIHDPCHLRHGQGDWRTSRTLLASIPQLVILEPEEADVCCGSGGAWSVQHPHLATEIGARKARILAANGADLIVTSNPGCLGQIADGLSLQENQVPILPLTDLVWFAARSAIDSQITI